MTNHDTALRLIWIVVSLGACSDELAQTSAAASTDALDDVASVSDSACSVSAGGTTWSEPRQLSVHLSAATIPGPLDATVTSFDDPTLAVVMTFDGTWNTFEGSVRSVSGTWLDVRGRMTGNALTVSYAERSASLGTSVYCGNLAGTATFSLPTPIKPPPPAWCEASAQSTGIHATLRIDTYEGIETGINEHEHARATIVKLPWIYDDRRLDTMHVELAMRVGPTGLPHELPLAAGQLVEVEGEYISGAVADAADPTGRLDAVIHYTHAECGYAIIAGARYN
jgi:hypothetical protein